MTPVLIVSTVNGVLSLLDTLLPVYKEMVAKGEIPVENQVALQARIEIYRSGEFFKTKHWQLPPAASTEVVPPPAGLHP